LRQLVATEQASKFEDWVRYEQIVGEKTTITKTLTQEQL